MRLRETSPIDLGLEEERRRAVFADLDVALVRHEERQIASGVSAPGADGAGYRLVSEAPLHEGRRNRVLRSGGVSVLAGREQKPVRRLLARDGKRPAHPAVLVSHEKESLAFELI